MILILKVSSKKEILFWEVSLSPRLRSSWKFSIPKRSILEGMLILILLEHKVLVMFASRGMFVFLKEKLSWYPDLVGKFYANMQRSRNKLEIYCLVDGTKFVLPPSLIEKVFHFPNSGVEFFGRSFG